MARKGFKPVNGFDKNPQRASLAGKKSATGLSRDLRESRIKNATEFEECIYKYMHLGLTELKKIYSDPLTPARDLVVIKILTKAIEQGDHSRLDFLLNRTIGKVVDKHEITAKPMHEQIIDMIEEEKKKGV